jgi:hypothetical protein
LPWLGQLVLLGLAYAACRGTPFGRRISPVLNLRRRFSEHVQALGERWAEARASRTALAAYAAWAIEVLRERLPSGTERSIAALARAVSQKTGRPAAEVARTLALAQLAQVDAEAPGSEADHLETLKQLGHLLEETGGSR